MGKKNSTINQETTKPTPIWSYETSDQVRAVTVSRDGEYVVAASDDKKVYFFDRSGKQVWTDEAGGTVSSMAASQGGEYVAAASWNHRAYFLDRSGKLL